MNQEPFTLEQLQKTIEDLTPRLYYGLSKFAERGQVYVCRATEWNPEFVIIHPDDLDRFKIEISPIRLVPLKDEPAGSVMERIKNRLTQHAAAAVHAGRAGREGGTDRDGVVDTFSRP